LLAHPVYRLRIGFPLPLQIVGRRARAGGNVGGMRILITGTLGYVGAVLIGHLRERFPQAELVGFDSGLFADCLTSHGVAPETRLSVQHFGDLRDIDATLLRGTDAVVHLAAISNDPIGARFEQATDAVNRVASLRLAALAAAAGVRQFVFASSCSVYGSAAGRAVREGDMVQPLTAYARSKVAVEDGLREFAGDGMAVTCLRFATACGMSARLRLDLVLNDFVAAAVSAGRIEVLSDGSPWRPLIDVRDMARAVEFAVLRPREAGGAMLTVNVGSDAGNQRVRDLAAAVAEAVPGTRVSVNAEAAPDARSYRVDFSRYHEMAPGHRPITGLGESIGGLLRGLRAIGFADPAFRRGERMIRLNRLAALLGNGSLTSELRWQTLGPRREAA
jgi:nucleoside-diphosphate-sugar epimerase